MISVDADFFEALIHSAESAGHLCAVGVGERVGQGDEVFFFGDHVLGHTAVALPTETPCAAPDASFAGVEPAPHPTEPAIAITASDTRLDVRNRFIFGPPLDGAMVTENTLPREALPL